MSHIKTLISARTGKKSYRVHIRTSAKTITKTFKKKSDAVQFSRTIEGNKDVLNSLVDPFLNQTFTEALETFIPAENAEPITGNDRNFRSRLETFEVLHGHLPLNQIKKSHVKQWLDSLGLAPATVNRHKTCFGSFSKWINLHVDVLWQPHRGIVERSTLRNITEQAMEHLA